MQVYRSMDKIGLQKEKNLELNSKKQKQGSCKMPAITPFRKILYPPPTHISLITLLDFILLHVLQIMAKTFIHCLPQKIGLMSQWKKAASVLGNHNSAHHLNFVCHTNQICVGLDLRWSSWKSSTNFTNV